MRKTLMRWGSLFALLAVGLGAFASHGLENTLSASRLEIFQTGVRYQFYHALGIILISLLLHFRKTTLSTIAGWLFVGGIILFSGSLYILAIRDLLTVSVSWLGPVTPIGGTLFIAGWVCLFLSTYQENQLQ